MKNVLKDIISNLLINKNDRINIKINKLKEDVKLCLELSKLELQNRKNGIEGESTIDQLEEVIIPDLTNLLTILDNKNSIPQKRVDRYSLAYGNAFRMWDWSMENPTELYKRLAHIHHDYQDVL